MVKGTSALIVLIMDAEQVQSTLPTLSSPHEIYVKLLKTCVTELLLVVRFDDFFSKTLKYYVNIYHLEYYQNNSIHMNKKIYGKSQYNVNKPMWQESED